MRTRRGGAFTMMGPAVAAEVLTCSAIRYWNDAGKEIVGLPATPFPSATLIGKTPTMVRCAHMYRRLFEQQKAGAC
ncbi:MAG: hypothetical protein IPI29_08610 [Ignavibacteria bacterium]|nr:hypothetical protein [Ignavibacteria bacterium]